MCAIGKYLIVKATYDLAPVLLIALVLLLSIIFFFDVPHLATHIIFFHLLNEPRIVYRNRPYLSSIRWDLNSRPLDRESSLQSTRPDFHHAKPLFDISIIKNLAVSPWSLPSYLV